MQEEEKKNPEQPAPEKEPETEPTKEPETEPAKEPEEPPRVNRLSRPKAKESNPRRILKRKS